ncbi:hypothetical protein T07_6824 [Trichinella nelsoni]|uniref:Secreted protein n=1 Tax=Trichinella nelsoni TaxID=6336 RepID=A0A0V0SG72_9BILA|nr:hypothetical protein T07_6824 [Trichinella nelsoni]
MTILNPASYLMIACVACLAPLYCRNRHHHSDDHPVTGGNLSRLCVCVKCPWLGSKVTVIWSSAWMEKHMASLFVRLVQALLPQIVICWSSVNAYFPTLLKIAT